MKRAIMFILFSIVCIPVFAQKRQGAGRWFVSPSVRALDCNSDPRSMMFTELAVGYELSPDVRLELAGGYAERGGRSVGTVDVMMTALSDNPRKWIVDPSLGLGLQKRSEWGGVRLTVPVQMRAGCRFTPGFEAGVNIKTFLGNRRHIMSTAGVFIAFRM